MSNEEGKGKLRCWKLGIRYSKLSNYSTTEIRLFTDSVPTTILTK